MTDDGNNYDDNDDDDHFLKTSITNFVDRRNWSKNNMTTVTFILWW